MLLNQETQGFSAESMRSMSTHGVTFLLDVPRVASGDRVLTQMVELGAAICRLAARRAGRR
jgi:hypothetical protein